MFGKVRDKTGAASRGSGESVSATILADILVEDWANTKAAYDAFDQSDKDQFKEILGELFESFE